MIHKFREVVKGKLYRGSSPIPQDVKHIKDKLGIKKIVSLDRDSGERISHTCKLLDIKQVKHYLEGDRPSLLHFVSQDLKKLLLEGGPTFIHCLRGIDRTGLAIALLKCRYFGVSSEKAIHEAKALGFGTDIPPSLTKLYEKLIRSCKPDKDQNNADIVSNIREYVGDNRDGPLNEAQRSSFAPYLEHTWQDPMNSVYTYTENQMPTRQTTHEQSIIPHSEEDEAVPQVGIFNNEAGLSSGGPTINMTGFLYD
jgi:hypothetical protein